MSEEYQLNSNENTLEEDHETGGNGQEMNTIEEGQEDETYGRQAGSNDGDNENNLQQSEFDRSNASTNSRVSRMEVSEGGEGTGLVGAATDDHGEHDTEGIEGSLEYEKISATQEEAYQNELERRKLEKWIELTDISKAPANYLKNTPEEEQILDYAENFRQQYSRLFPSRKELILSPINEFGVKKFICSTIKPTRLNFKELYDYRTCAEFVSNYLVYEQLDPCYELPRSIYSPSLNIIIQHGNCFDMAILLTCLLRGAGYDAYVVSGYASKQMATMDNTQSSINVENLLESYSDEKFLMNLNLSRKESTVVDQNVSSKYKLKTVKKLVSGFLEKQAEKMVNSEKDKLNEATAKEDTRRQQKDMEEDEEDEFAGLRIYAWVMILPGRREVPEPFFIDPPTGKQYSTEDSNFVGVESVFSSRNYWVNMQPCYDGLKVCLTMLLSTV